MAPAMLVCGSVLRGEQTVLATVTTTTEPSRPATKGREDQNPLYNLNYLQTTVYMEPECAADKAGFVWRRTELEFQDSVSEPGRSAISVEYAIQTVQSLAAERISRLPSPVWILVKKVRPLPTADGNALIEIEPSVEERQSIEALWRTLPESFKQESRELILRAYLLASYAHRNVRRDSGEPYITHPIAVAQILTELRMDPEALAAGLLHDVAEDTEFSIDYIRTHFDPTIAKLVDGVTKLKKIQETRSKSDTPVSNQKAESLRKMMLASIEDLRVLIIKLADRLHNMRTLAGQKEHKRRRICP